MDTIDREVYEKIIELMATGIDYKEFTLKLIKNDPKLFISLYYKEGTDFLIIEKYKTSGLIPAIKLCREKIPLGLKEAKDYVEALVHDDKNKEI